MAPWVIPGAMDGAAFDHYVETWLAPLLQPGDVVILDNLPVHRSAFARAIVGAVHGCCSCRNTRQT